MFQMAMDVILKGLCNVQAFIDDLLIWEEDDERLLMRVREVLARLEQYNVKINVEKCEWFVPKVKYLGHILSENGVAPNPEKVQAIMKAPIPTSVTQLKAYLVHDSWHDNVLQQVCSKSGKVFNSITQIVG